jgi:hypothetical protein
MEKVLQKALKKYGIKEDEFNKVQEFIELLKEDETPAEEVVEETQEESVEPAQEKPEEVQAEAPTQPQQSYTLEDVKKELGFDKYDAIIVEHQKTIKELQEEIKKTRNAGYTPGASKIEKDTTVDDIFANLKKVNFK